MAWNYDVTKLDTEGNDGILARIRFMCGDIEVEYKYLQDEEVLYLYNHESDRNELQTAILCVKRMIAKVAKQINYTIGPERVNAQYRMANFEKLLAQLENEAMSVGHMNMPSIKTHSPIFKIGMMDSPSNKAPWGW